MLYLSPFKNSIWIENKKYMYILNDKVKKRFGWGIELKAVFLFENKKTDMICRMESIWIDVPVCVADPSIYSSDSNNSQKPLFLLSFDDTKYKIYEYSILNFIVLYILLRISFESSCLMRCPFFHGARGRFGSLRWLLFKYI